MAHRGHLFWAVGSRARCHLQTYENGPEALVMDRVLTCSKPLHGSLPLAHMHPGAHSTSQEALRYFSCSPSTSHPLFSFKLPSLCPSPTLWQAGFHFTLPPPGRCFPESPPHTLLGRAFTALPWVPPLGLSTPTPGSDTKQGRVTCTWTSSSGQVTFRWMSE